MHSIPALGSRSKTCASVPSHLSTVSSTKVLTCTPGWPLVINSHMLYTYPLAMLQLDSLPARTLRVTCTGIVTAAGVTMSLVAQCRSACM